MKANEDIGLKGAVVPQGAPRHELTREFYTKERGAHKRPYVYNFAKARTCPHSSLKAMAVGGSAYRCEDCNYTFDIVAANMQPLHNRVLGDMMNMLHFVKEFGVGSFEEVLRTPIGQYDKTPQKPAIPDGMSIAQALLLMDEVDVTAPDGGKAQVKALLDQVWVSDEERQRRLDQLAGKAVLSHGQKRELDAGNGSPQLSAGEPPKRHPRAKVRALPEREHPPVP